MRLKSVFISVCCLFVISVLTACNHQRLNYSCDRNYHWVIDSDGNRANITAHDIEDMRICKVCNSCASVLENGDVVVYTYNEHDDITRKVTYDSFGSVISEDILELTYDSNDNLSSCKIYRQGVLVEEQYFAPNDKNEDIICRQINYGQDGTVWVHEFDAHGYRTRSNTYDENRVLLNSVEYQYGNFDADNTTIETKEITFLEYGIRHETILNEHGDWIEWCEYASDGSLMYSQQCEYKYDDSMRVILSLFYEEGTLRSETRYFWNDDNDKYSRKVTLFVGNGSKEVCRYNEDDELIEKTLFDSEGNVIEDTDDGSDEVDDGYVENLDLLA